MLHVGQVARLHSFHRRTGLQVLQREGPVHSLLLRVPDAKVVVVDDGQAEVVGITGQRYKKIRIPEKGLT